MAELTLSAADIAAAIKNRCPDTTERTVGRVRGR
jgi:hypothetical protein